MQTSIEPSANSEGQGTSPQLPITNTRIPQHLASGFGLEAPNKPPNPAGVQPTAELSTPAALPSAPPPIQPTTSKAKQPLAVDSSLGKLDLRTASEESEFQKCEAIVRESWTHFARVGEALATIRDKKLYKDEYPDFETYCRERWCIGHSQAWRYISGAQVHKTLGTVPGIPLPEFEAKVRPLVGLADDLAQEAWLHALSWCRDGHVPARFVKRAVKQVLKTDQPALAVEPQENRMQRSRLRQSVRTGFQELLALLLGSAERDVVIAKVQELQGLLDPILVPKKTKV